MNDLKESKTPLTVGQTDLDGWMNARHENGEIYKVRAPWWIKEEMKGNEQR